MVAPVKEDITVAENIEVLKELGGRLISLLGQEITTEVVDKLVLLKADYIRLIGPESSNVLSLGRRINHYRDVLETQPPRILAPV